MRAKHQIAKNENFANLVAITEATLHTLQTSTNTYLANILGLYSYGENEKHKPDFLMWNLLHISTNIQKMGNHYSIINPNELDNTLIKLSKKHLHSHAQYYFGKLLKQVYDCFEYNKYLLNTDICQRCNLYTEIKSQKDYVSWSLLYVLYHAGFIDRHIKSTNKNGKKTYKWIKTENNTPFHIGACFQRQIDYNTKISYAHYETLMVLTELKDSNKIGNIISEYKDQACRDINCLPFDVMFNSNTNKKVYVELDGEQHFKETFFSKGNKLEYIQRHDRIKTNFVVNNDSLLIRIPYSDNHKIKKILTAVVDNMLDSKGFYASNIDKYSYLKMKGNSIVI